MKKTALLLLVIFSIFSVNASFPITTVPGKMLILMGQSNMVLSSNDIIKLVPSNWMVVKCAVGGTTISQWQKGEYLYENCRNIVNLNKAKYPIKAIMFMQGEGDSKNPNCDNWKNMFLTMATNFRKDVNFYGKFSVGRIGPVPVTDDILQKYCWNKIRTQQTYLKYSGFTIVSSDGLPCWNVPHWCTSAYPILAKRFVSTITIP